MKFPRDDAWARDAADPLRPFRDQFRIPPRPDGEAGVYLCGHSLGLQPLRAREYVLAALEDWAELGVEGHFRGRNPWYPYHEQFREPLARLTGALPDEVVAMNGLTVNLHLLLATFYRPTAQRDRIVIDGPTFPSDLYAVQSLLRWHGRDPMESLIILEPEPGDGCLREEHVETLLRQQGERVAVVLFSGVNFLTGQRYDLNRITAAAHAAGAAAGFDLAHAIGNVPLHLHDWDADFAVWCGYKYLNGGPGAGAGAFVHQRHGHNPELPRLAGWWGNEPETRFRMQLEPRFVPKAGADGWQLSNPPILAFAPLKASLELFDAAGMPALRAKSEALTGYLESLIDDRLAGRVEVVSPRRPEQRGCQLSLMVRGDGRAVMRSLEAAGVTVDFREPNVIRAAPVPLYNRFADVWRFVEELAKAG